MSDFERPAVRATDADREAAVDLLRRASVDGRLTVEELSERAELAQQARTRDELERVTADLGHERAPVPVRPGSQRAIFSGLRRDGRWRLEPDTRYTAVCGSIHLDLRRAVLPGPEVTIDVLHVFGSVTVLVPEGAEVVLERRGAFSGSSVRIDGEEPPPGAPVVRIRSRGYFANVDVRSRPGGLRGLAEQLGITAPPGT